MLKEKERDFQAHIVNLDTLVPEDNFYRKVEAKLDLNFIRDLVQRHYSSRMGRPSIDPVVFFKLQLIMFFEGIRSERQLMDMVTMRFDHRWYIGYDLNENVPDHSSLSKIRDRYGLEVFQRFFEQIVQFCIEAGLVWGKEFYFDGTKIEANAAFGSLVPRFAHEAQQHLKTLFNDEPELAPATEAAPNPRDLHKKYNGRTRYKIRPQHWYKRKTDYWVSPVDPDASPLSPFTGNFGKLGYHTHYVVDGGKARIILAALTTPAAVQDNTPMLDLARWLRFRWHLQTDIAVGDTKYGTLTNILGLEQDGIRPYLPTPDHTKRTKFYGHDQFHYDAERNLFICPQGQELPLHKHSNTEFEYVYRADRHTCNACPVKSKCTKSKSGRHLRRSFFQDSLDRAQSHRETEAYKKAMRKRQVWIEPMFGEAKQWHNMRKFRLRGLIKVNIQALLTAAGQNIKRLLKQKVRKYTPDPATPVALRLPFCFATI